MNRVAAGLFAVVACLALVAPSANAQDGKIIKSYGLSTFGPLKYPADFKHFDYANPNAPKGGEISTIDYSGFASFDSLNAFYYLGNYASGLEIRPELRSLVFDTLMADAKDTPDDMYGLVAKSVEYPPDRSWIIFNLRPEARFQDGSKLTAEDVAFSIQLLKEKAAPRYRYPLAAIKKIEVLGPYQIKFTFGKTPDARSMPLVVADMPIFSKAYYTKHKFSETSLDVPLGSGPYKIVDVEQGRSITYRRDPNYWAKDLPVSRGILNFDKITFEYFRDRGIALQAFKAGVYSFREEFTSKSWATEYHGPPFEKGIIKTEEVPDHAPAPMEEFYMNTRRKKFQDMRVREALTYAFDFEWMNKNLFFGAYRRLESIFENTDLAQRGKPSPAELKLLDPWRGKVPDAVFGEAYVAPKTNGSGNDRTNLRKAIELFTQAGYTIKNGEMTGPDGKPFQLEFLSEDPTTTRILTPYVEALKRIGVTSTIRLVDSTEYQSRVRSFDFDMILQAFGSDPTPGPADLTDMWTSQVANQNGSYNLSGVRSPAVDALVQAAIGANSREELETACRALDRVIMDSYYFIPAWWRAYHPIAYQNKFSRPKVVAKYAFDPIETWWVDPAKKKRLEELRGR